MDWSWGFLWEALEYLLGILACYCLGRLGWFGTVVVCKEQEAQAALQSFVSKATRTDSSDMLIMPCITHDLPAVSVDFLRKLVYLNVPQSRLSNATWTAAFMRTGNTV